jgi:hypothetical protein
MELYEDLGGRTPREILDAIPDWGNAAILGVADRMLDLGVDLRPFQEELMPIVQAELSEEELASWCGPEDRVEALRNFERRLRGEKVSAEDLEIDNMGLFARAGKSNEEIRDIITSLGCATIDDVMTQWYPLWGSVDPDEEGFGEDWVRQRLQTTDTRYDEVTRRWLGDAYEAAMVAATAQEEKQ